MWGAVERPFRKRVDTVQDGWDRGGHSELWETGLCR